jgi:phage-related protein
MLQLSRLTAPPRKKISVVFFTTERGNEPVRSWLKDDLLPEERKLVGEDIKTVEFGWPLGMPICRSLDDGLHEVRTTLANKIARVIFYVDARQRMVLLHGFIKKNQQTPLSDLRLARARKAQHRKGL